MKHGELPPGQATTRCQSRFGGNIGFEGDPDFYGLGIRLGIYLQWLAAIINNTCTAEERQSVLTGHLVLSLFVIIALLVKIFSAQCAFTAEIDVLVSPFWGGQINVTYAILISMMAVIPGSASTRSQRRIGVFLNALMSPVTIWFWKLAAVGQLDFAATPGGTGIFYRRRNEGTFQKFNHQHN